MFTDDDYETISKVSNLDHITKYDTLNDKTISFTDTKEEAYIFGLAKDIDTFDGKLDVGRMPENDHEIAVLASTYDYYLKDNTIDITYYKRKDLKIKFLISQAKSQRQLRFCLWVFKIGYHKFLT